MLLDQNRYSNRFPSSSVASPNPIGYPSSLTSPNNEEVPTEMVIPFSRVVTPKANYLVKSTGIMKE